MNLTTSFIHIFKTPFNFRHQILENWISAVGRLWFSAPQMTLSQSDYYPWTCYILDFVKRKIKDVGELRQRIVEEWEQLGQHVIDNAIRQWHRRLRE